MAGRTGGEGHTVNGLYVHIPFCGRRCHYCDFVSTEGVSPAGQARYRKALRREMALYADDVTSVGWESVYFGGGTPTYLDENSLTGIFADLLSGRPFGECTVEANPDTLTKEKLTVLRNAGCSRLSIGAQSFDDPVLIWLGRSHDAAGFRRAWTLSREAGFSNMNLDLLYGIAGQRTEDWARTLREALTICPEHISLYQLSVEMNTEMGRRVAARQPCVADEEICRALYISAHRMLTEAGYTHYEISNYALPGRESRHNTLYWRNGHYLGLGAGASGYLPGVPGVLPGRRYRNQPDIRSYIADLEREQKPVAEEEAIDDRLAMAEELMLAFRLREGVGLRQFRERWGIDLRQKFGADLDRRLHEGMLEETGDRIRPTVEGWLMYNVWIPDFL